MKRALAGVILFLLVAVFPISCGYCQEGESVDLESSVDELLSGIDFTQWDDLLGAQRGTAQALVEKLAEGGMNGSAESWLKSAAEGLLPGVRAQLGGMGLVVGLAVLGGILARLSGGEGLGEAAQAMCFALSAACLLAGFGALARQAIGVITAVVAFSEAVLPVLLALLTALGAPTAAGAFQPAILSLTFLCTGVARGFLCGLLLLAAALGVIKNLDPEIKCASVLTLIKSVCKWTLSVSLAVFGAALLINGVASATLDGVSLRTAKYAIDNFIPVVGGLIADSFDTLVGCCLIVKNAVGTAGLIWVVYILSAPMLKLVSAICAYRLSAALLQTVGCERTVGLLDDLASILSLFTAVIAACGLMLIMLIAAVLTCGGAVTGLR